jgi:hypothetical protein
MFFVILVSLFFNNHKKIIVFNRKLLTLQSKKQYENLTAKHKYCNNLSLC